MQATLIHPVLSPLGQACLDRLTFMRPPRGSRLWLGPVPESVELRRKDGWDCRNPGMGEADQRGSCLRPFVKAGLSVIVDTVSWQTNGLTKEWFVQVRECLADGGVFVFAGLGPSSLRGLNRALDQQGLAWNRLLSLARLDELPDMHDLGDLLQASGLSSPVMESDPLIFSYQTPRQLIKDFRAWPLRHRTAASNRQVAPATKGAGPGSEFSGSGPEESSSDKASWPGAQAFRTGFRALERAQDLGVVVDWELVIGHAWRPAPPPKTPPEAEKPGFSPLRFFRKKP